MTLFEGLQASPTLLVVAVAILGLLVGSFLNVVILRLPRIMEQNWKRDARDALELPAIEEPRLSLSHPASCCPSCKAPIRPWQNVPVISWLALRGRCANCRAPISAQYPLVEASCALLRSEEHTSELQSLMRISYAVFRLKKKTEYHHKNYTNTQ